MDCLADPDPAILIEAADEIERTALYDTIAHANKVQAEEIKRLTAELAGTKDELYSVDKAAKELGAELDRLQSKYEPPKST